MAKFAIFAILILAIVSLDARGVKDCEGGILCKDFCCDSTQLCCYDSMSGTYYCDKKCDFQARLKTSKANECEGIQCQEFCCDSSQLCCYDTMSGTYYCDKKCDF